MNGMEHDWSSLFGAAASLFLFALATQCVLAWLFTLVFLSFFRAARGTSYFGSWTCAWSARAVGLTAILLRFSLPLASGREPQILDGTFFSNTSYFVYQAAKLLACWWLLEGIVSFAGHPVRPRRWVPIALVAVGASAVLVARNVEDLLLIQAPLNIAANLVSVVVLMRLPASRRNVGTRMTWAALLAQVLLWVAYAIALLDSDHGPWPLVRTPMTILLAHNSYFDLALDVLVGSGLIALLLQDVHRRQLETEADRVRMRAELERSERLRSLGTLVSGVAHELNNPLAAILGFAETISATTDETESARQADIIREQALRCRRIVRGLSTFSGKGSEVFERIRWRPLLERVTRGFEFELGRKGVLTSIRVDPGLPELVGDRFALEQMVANLLANALQASPAGETVTLAASARGDELELCVDDNGPGFPADVGGRVFDPFFTTRGPGEGMGLGLTVVHGIALAHEGTVRAENRAEGGARVTVTLPVRGGGLRERKDTPGRRRPRTKRLEVLVIEDETLLCEMFRTLGARNGWNVTLAGSGQAGLAHLRREGESFDVVLCDLRMAAPSGIEIHDILQREAPKLLDSFVFVTGDLSSKEAIAFVARCGRPILEKPFALEALVAEVEELAALRDPG